MDILSTERTNKLDYFQLYKRMFPYLKPYLFRFIVTLLLTIPIGALDAVIAYALRPFTDVVMFEKNLKYAFYIPIAIIGFTTIQGALNYIATYMNGWLGQRVTNDIKSDLYSQLLKLETRFFDKGSSGIVFKRFGADPDLVTNGILNNAKLIFTKTFSSISLICVLLYNSWMLAAIAISVILLIFVPLTQIRKRVKRITDGMVRTDGIIISHYNETYAGNKILSSYNLAKYQLNRFKAIIKDSFYLNMKITKINAWLNPFMHMTASVGIAAVIGVGSYLIMSDKISSGAFVSFIIALVMLYTPLKTVGSTALSTHVSFLAMDRVLEIIEYSPKIRSKENPVELKTIEKGIQFENVCFAYEENKPVLKNINLDIKVGETIALVGNSGGGKSTFVNLIPRFYDVLSGRIAIDGVDVRDLDLYSLRDKIAIVFQDNYLFGGTIKENIMLGKLNATDEEIQKAVSGAYLSEFIASLEKGLNTQIGERGVLLSGGQKQRVGIARALLKNAPVVILDEATSALDNKSEAMVQKAIDELMKDRTVFVIAHRLSTVQNATRIVVIDEGRILEIGSHNELMAKSDGIYKNLYYAQFKEKPEQSENEIAEECVV